jgi:hypothetical protein
VIRASGSGPGRPDGYLPLRSGNRRTQAAGVGSMRRARVRRSAAPCKPQAVLAGRIIVTDENGSQAHRHAASLGPLLSRYGARTCVAVQGRKNLSESGAARQSRLQTPLAVGVVGVMLGLIGGFLLRGVRSPLAHKPSPHLEIFALAATDGLFRDVRTQAQYEQAKPHLDLTVFNSGDRRSVVTEAQAEVLSAVRMPACEQAGALEATKPTDVVLPTNPPPGRILHVPVTRQVGQDSPDLIRLRFELPSTWMSSHGEESRILYRMVVTLIHDGGEKLKAGVVLLAVPDPPAEDTFDTRGDTALAAAFGPAPERCRIRQRVHLKRLLNLPGIRSDRLRYLSTLG